MPASSVPTSGCGALFFVFVGFPSLLGRYEPGDHARIYSPGGGMVGTMSDYAKFALCLANGGELNGVGQPAPSQATECLPCLNGCF